MVKRVLESREGLNRLEERHDSLVMSSQNETGRPDATNSLAGETGEVGQQVERTLKEHQRLLAVIEAQNPSLYQLRELKPLDPVALRASLSEDSIVVQYLPTGDQLHI